MLSKKNAIFWLFGMTRPGIELRSLGLIGELAIHYASMWVVYMEF